MSVYHVQMWCLWRSEESVRVPGTGVTEGYEPSDVCWEPKLGPLYSSPLRYLLNLWFSFRVQFLGNTLKIILYSLIALTETLVQNT